MALLYSQSIAELQCLVFTCHVLRATPMLASADQLAKPVSRFLLEGHWIDHSFLSVARHILITIS